MTMIFGRSIYFLTSNSTLTVISPIDAVFNIGAVVVFLLVACIFLATGKVRTWNALLWLAIATYTFSVTTSHCKVVLDGAKGTVNVTTVLFFRPKHYEYDLADLQGASVGDSEQSDALRLVFNGGSSLQLTPYNQMGGKGEAAFAINRFVQQHGGAGSPY